MPVKERVSLYLMPDLKEWLDAESKRTGKSKNTIIIQMLEAKKSRARP